MRLAGPFHCESSPSCYYIVFRRFQHFRPSVRFITWLWYPSFIKNICHVAFTDLWYPSWVVIPDGHIWHGYRYRWSTGRTSHKHSDARSSSCITPGYVSEIATDQLPIPLLWIEWGRSARHSFLICIANQFSANVIWQVPAPASASISGRFKWKCTFGVLRRTPGYTLVEEQYRKRWMVTHPASVRICLTCCRSKPPSSIPCRDTLGTDVTLWIFLVVRNNSTGKTIVVFSEVCDSGLMGDTILNSHVPHAFSLVLRFAGRKTR